MGEISFPTHRSKTNTAARLPLPPELIDMIIRQLDNETLLVCALVCRSWVPESRRLLPPFVVNLCPFSEDESTMLASPLCTITAAVNHLELVKSKVFDELNEGISRLSNIKHLTLYNCEAHFDTLTFPPFLKNLESLRLINVIFNSVKALVLLLRHCPRLQSINCYSVSVKNSNPQVLPNDQNALTPELKILKVQQGYNLLEYLVGHWDSAIPRISVLDLDYFDRLVGRLLDATGSSLQDLRLRRLPKNPCESFE